MKACKDPKADPSPNNLKLDLLPQNIFVPKNYRMVEPLEEDKTNFPELILKTSHTKLWYQYDDEFRMPKACINLNIYLDDENWTTDIKSHLLAKLWIKMFSKDFQKTKNLMEKAS